MTHPDAARGEWFGDSEEEDPVAYIRALLDREPEVTGCKLPHNNLADHPAVSRWLRSGSEPAVIRLVRRNTLALLVSRRLLMASLFARSVPGGEPPTTVSIDAARCARILERIELEDRELDELAAGHPTFRIAYEDLARSEGLSELQSFLGVEPAALRSPHRRGGRPLSDSVENWEELAEALRGTRFASLLEDAPTASS